MSRDTTESKPREGPQLMLQHANHPVLMVHEAPPPGRTWTRAEVRAVTQAHEGCPVTLCPARRFAKYVLAQRDS